MEDKRKDAETPRRSSRMPVPSEKGIKYQTDLLTNHFTDESADLLSFLADTEIELQREVVDCDDLFRRRTQISERLQSIRDLADRLQRLGSQDKSFSSDLEQITNSSVTVLNKIVTATKHLNSSKPPGSHKSTASRSSVRTNASVDSKRLMASSEAAALKVRLEAMKSEDEARRRVSRLEEELADMKRKLEREKLESQIREEEARIQILDELSGGTDTSSVSVPPDGSCQLQSDKYAHAQLTGPRTFDASPNLRPQATEFQPSGMSDIHILTDSLARAIASSRLPVPEPPVFTGDPLLYQDWLFSFQSLIENRGVPPSEKIHYLKRYLGGAAKEAVSGFFMLRSDRAYDRAKEILEKRFGDPFVVSEAFRTELDKWPNVSAKDRSSLRKYSDFLCQCQAAVAEIDELNILNDIREIGKAAAKLPDWLTHRWNRKVAVTKREVHRYPTFEEFADFVKEESDILNDPVLACRPAANQIVVKTRNQRPPEPRAVFNTGTGEPPKRNCVFCKRQNHTIGDCREFAKSEMADRKLFIKKEGLCFGCLRSGHRSKNCTNRSECKTCKRRHPTCLHDDKPPPGGHSLSGVRPPGGSSSPPSENTEKKEVVSGSSESAGCRKVSSAREDSLTSMAVPVYLSSEEDPGHEVLTYALLDTMSDTTFVRDSVVSELDTSSKPAALRLTTMTDGGRKVVCRSYAKLRVRGFGSDKIVPLPTTYSRDSIPLNKSHIPTPETADQWPHLTRLNSLLAPRQNCDIGLLIGYDCPRALAPLNSVVGDNDQPYAVETELGWSIVGGGQRVEHSVLKTQVEDVTTGELVKLMGQGFEGQTSNNKPISQEDKRFLKTLEDGIHHREDGYYEMPLPFRDGEPKLPNNRQTAMHRAHALKRQFEKRPEYLRHYTTFMKEIIERGDAEKVPPDEMNNDRQWYIPHHGVYNDNKPGKVRVVFDCSAKHQGVCLNDHLLPGPDLINSLVGVLCRFREGPIAFSCDIEKMFHQFRVERGHQDYLRFLWWEDGDLSRPPSDFRMKVHLFGATSSPGCANFALKKLADDHRHMGENATEFLRQDFYVDDGLKGEYSVKAAKDLLDKARLICAKGNLRLHKIVSNCAEVMESVPETERGRVPPVCLDADREDSKVEKTLGLQWCVNSDTLCFKLNLRENPLTRRGVLSTVASVYDPLGLIAPVILIGRLILQEMCRDRLTWDEPMSEALLPRWESWRRDLHGLRDVSLPRCYLPDGFGKPLVIQLHHFSDASQAGYGQCSYLRLENDKGQVHCTLIMGKARVTPLKPTTIPRLELQAAVLSANAAKFLESELTYKDIQHFFWTDSKIVLGYIQNESARFHTYVANRVEQIHQATKPEQWHHVSTEENPADHVSRGLSTADLATSSWFSGPSFLWEKDFVIKDTDTRISDQDPEVKAIAHLSQKPSFTSFEDRVQRFSSYKKLIAATAVIVRLCARKQSRELTPVQARQESERALIRIIQKEHYDSKDLKSKSHPLRSLDPFVDGDNLLRVGGRVRNSSEAYEVKHPLILPKTSHLTRLMATRLHEEVAHQGRNLTINHIRSRGLWIVGCRRVVSSIINSCTNCIRNRGQEIGQKMADLPTDRLEPSPPFTYCGLDCFGPFVVKEGRKEVKRYGLLLTCLASRAVHIELLDDLSTDCFLNGLRCFIAIRGKVRVIRCDQGTNFVGAKHELKQAFEELNRDSINARMLDMDCEFKFNPPSASHMGGVWERQIRTVRSVLAGILDKSTSVRLDTASLRTLLYEVMAIVNSRPLTSQELERSDGPLPLTPNHLLTMKSGLVVPPPPGTFQKEDLYLRKRWRRVQFLAEQFWSRWKREYLQTLQPRVSSQTERPNVCRDDVVLLRDDDTCRASWRMARVTDVFPGKDGLVRRVKLLMATPDLDNHGRPLHQRSVLERPVHKLVVLVPSGDPDSV